ncbi:hypothetical protein LH400_11580, partial [Aurantimonas sp. VKM B-3413]|nr:hypothetical protein [Aurantimonas sp. VKM B-3413]
RSVNHKSDPGKTHSQTVSKILEEHTVDPADMDYLRWIKGKRDYFVHRLFHEGAWPGDLDEHGSRFMMRQLLAIQLWLERADRRIWTIFERAGFLEVQQCSDGSFLALDANLRDIRQAEGDGDGQA